MPRSSMMRSVRRPRRSRSSRRRKAARSTPMSITAKSASILPPTGSKTTCDVDSQKGGVRPTLARRLVDALFVARWKFSRQRVAHPVGNLRIEVRQAAAEGMSLILVDPQFLRTAEQFEHALAVFKRTQLVELAHRQQRRTFNLAGDRFERHLLGHGVELILVMDVRHVHVVSAIGRLGVLEDRVLL